jgi:hypothetical protein
MAGGNTRGLKITITTLDLVMECRVHTLAAM